MLRFPGMARPIWTGAISFGLVNIPIKLFGATESHRVGFRELEEGTGRRIRYKRVAEGSGRQVEWKDIQKGYEVGKDRYVVLTDEELETASPEKTRAIEIERFVPLADIDPVAWDQSYYASPDGTAAGKAYVLLREAMRKEKRVAIGTFVMRTKEYVACIRPLENALALHTLFFADEVRDVKDVVTVPARASVGAKELAMATQLIGSLSGKWEPARYEDTFRERVLTLVKKKDNGQVIEAPADAEKSPKIADLMEALKATLEEGKKLPRRGVKVPETRHAAKKRVRRRVAHTSRSARTEG
jgi:DNA end-binding protein Ku